MSALGTLGLRLARAGGPVRVWSLVLANAVGAFLVVVAVMIPGAVVAEHAEPTTLAVNTVAARLALLLPAVILLLTAGRLSSGVRDRRLAALRMLGTSPWRTRAVAAVENGALAVAGAVPGSVAAVALVPALGRTVAEHTAVEMEPLTPAWPLALGVAAGVVVLSIAVGTGPTWDRELPGQARSESASRTPRTWRAGVLLAGTATLAATWWVGEQPSGARPVPVEVLLLTGGVLTALGIALTTPLVTAWVTRAMVRAPGIAPMLAGRAVETDSLGASRMVAGLGVAVFLTAGALGVIANFESAPHYRYAVQMVTDGPQKIWLDADEATAADEISTEAMASARDIPGVHGVVPARPTFLRCADDLADGGCEAVFVGTCAELALVSEISGCIEGRAAWIVGPDGRSTDTFRPGEVDTAAPIVVTTPSSPEGFEVTPSESVHVDVAADVDRWVYPTNYAAIVPPEQVADLTGPVTRADVIADGGTDVQEAVVAWAEGQGLRATPYPGEGDIASVAQVRTVVLALAGVVLGVGLLTIALAATDRAVERRRHVARQVMVGVPVRVLRSGQLLQVLVPTAVAAVLGAGCGWLLVRSYSAAGEIIAADARLGGRWALLAALVGAGALLVALATMPLIRTRLTPDLLRRE